jgi:hypothetical protein
MRFTTFEYCLFTGLRSFYRFFRAAQAGEYKVHIRHDFPDYGRSCDKLQQLSSVSHAGRFFFETTNYICYNITLLRTAFDFFLSFSSGVPRLIAFPERSTALESVA